MIINRQMASLAQHSLGGFSLKGPYGEISVWPDSAEPQYGEEPTYWVDLYFGASLSDTACHTVQHGFRLSTVLCLCAGLCEGEKALNEQMINDISAWFTPTSS